MRFSRPLPHLSGALLTMALLVASSAHAADPVGGESGLSKRTALDCPDLPEYSDRCPMWTAAYDHPSYTGLFAGEDVANAIAVAPSGHKVFVTGRSWQAVPDGRGFDVATVSYDAETGEQIWATRTGGPGGGNDGATDIATDGTSVFITGQAGGGGSAEGDFLTVSYDAATGEHQWVQTRSGPGGGRDTARTLSLDPANGLLYVAGFQDHDPGSSWSDIAVVAYRAGDGSQEWAATYESPAGGTDFATDTALSPDGRVLYVTGSTEETRGGGIYDSITVAYRALAGPGEGEDEGTQLWATRSGDPGLNEQPVAMAATDDGSRIVVAAHAETAGTTAGVDYLLIAYEASTGNTAWEARLSGPGGLLGDDRDEAVDLVVSGDGAYVTGTSSGQGGCTLTTASFSVESGEERWRATYHLPFLDDCTEAASVVADSDRGIVYSSGSSIGAVRTGIPNGGLIERRNYVTVAYDAESGAQLWAGRFNSSENGTDADYAQDSALSPDGLRLFVTGAFGYQPPRPIAENTWDYGTIAYDTALPGDPGYP